MDVLKALDATIIQIGGIDWVKSLGRGVSTSSRPKPFGARQWLLPSGSAIPVGLALVNDKKQHWQWEPINDMPLADYVAALASLNGTFR